jgi:ABC-type multidrug transport system fused ATPase/permease subunit
MILFSNKSTNGIGVLLRALSHLSKPRQVQLCLLIALMLISSVAEIFSLASIFPFLAVLSNPQQLFENPLALRFIRFTNTTSPPDLLVAVTLLFVFAVTFACLARLLNSWLTGRLAACVGTDISSQAYSKILYQPYSIHLNLNSGAVISELQSQIPFLVESLNLLFALATSYLLLAGYLIILLFVNAPITLSAAFVFGLTYYFISTLGSKSLSTNSQVIALLSAESVKSLQDGLGAIRDIIIDGTQSFFLDSYTALDRSLRQRISQSQFIGSYPRYLVEAVGLVLIAIIALFVTNSSSISGSTLPLLGILALGAQRILPILQQIYASRAGIKARKSSVENLLSRLNLKICTPSAKSSHANNLQFNNEINFECVSFSYDTNYPAVLSDLSFTIKKGDRVGIIGSTGCGKTTLTDLIMGLFKPTLGRITVDGVDIHEIDQPERISSWQSKISHVPQSIYLSDRTIAENIAFGIKPDDINMSLVVKAAQQAQIAQYINSTPDKYNTLIGERGLKLSGGQRQRLGVARALYKSSQILILDEATSALDGETEKYLIEAMNTLPTQMTLIMVAHRLSTLDSCNRIIDLNQVRN